MRERSRSFLLVTLGLIALPGCGGDEWVKSSEVDFAPVFPEPPGSARPGLDDPIFVLPGSDSLVLFDVERAEPADRGGWRTFALEGSPDDNDDGARVGFVALDATAEPVDDVVVNGSPIAVGDRTFQWIDETESQRIYVGPTPSGRTIALLTGNVDESTAVALLAQAEISNGRVLFGGRPTPDGWVDTGATTAAQSFVAGATGSSAPIGGTRSLYGDSTAPTDSTWDDVTADFGVTLSSWPVTSDDPDNEARYSLAGEVDVVVLRSDGTTTTGFGSPPDSEFFECVVWRAEQTWLALARPASGDVGALIELAATVRVASSAEGERFEQLAAD